MGEKESGNDYTSTTSESSAVGKYQHLWNTHSIEIGKLTGVKTKEEYKNNPAAQERYQAHLVKQYEANIPGIRGRYNLSKDKVADETLMMLQHYLGVGDIEVYLKELMSTGDYNSAQKAVDKSILTRMQKKNPKAVLPKNKPIVNYLTEFISELNNLPATVSEVPVAEQQPEVKVQPKTQPKVTTPTPTRTGPRKQTIVTPVQEPSIVENISSGVSNITSNIKQGAINTYNDFEETVKKGVSSGFGTAVSGAATVGRNIAELFDADEDQINVLKYLENGGTVSDAYDMYKNQQAKKLGSEGSDLIGESKSIAPSADVETTLTNWGTKFIKPKENLVAKKYVVDTKEVSGSPSVDQDKYTSNSFAVNLKSNAVNKFTVLPNIHANSGVGNINDYYNNFTPVNGSLVFTIQNDVVSGQKPLTTVSKGDSWYKNAENIIKMNGNKLEVVKSKDVKEGDKLFKLTNKIFSFDDFDIKDGKINTAYDSNINALIPKVKSDAKTYKAGSSFVIGLTDKKKTPGYIPLDEATQYGKSRGGSFVLFSEDLDQQYMVGGSFKNLYDFYQNVKKMYPDKKFKVFASDTGSYSNSFFPKNGKIDGDVYRKSNNRNVWGEVQHLILMN